MRDPAVVPPTGLSARPGRGVVTLTWDRQDGAVGYQVYVADGADEPLRPLDHAGRDVLAVPHPPYADTTGTPGRARWYAVTTLTEVTRQSEPSARVMGTPSVDGPAAVQVDVDATRSLGELPRPWRPMIGSEHLSHTLCPDETAGRPIGRELSAALAAAARDLGVRHVRAHGILCDDLQVYREVDGTPQHDFSRVDRVYDHVLSLGLTPIVELSFMPHDLARDPSATVFDYRAIISPPKDWQRWYDLVHDFSAHLVDRYGRQELREKWAFEVWNEPNLAVFWSGTPEEWFRLYDVSAAAVRAVDPHLRVGGPASAAAGWVAELLAHTASSGAPVDFVSTHTYGSPPLDLRPLLARYGRGAAPLWWTEWGVTPAHFNEVSDAVFAGVFLLQGMVSAMGRIEALSYWVASDHFEELGRPTALLHGGFGLRTVGELRKPRWWALAMLERLGATRLPVTAAGDGGGSLVNAVATRANDGTVSVLVWNLTLDQTKAAGSPPLSRTVTVRVAGLAPGSSYGLTHLRLDGAHSNIAAVWGRIRREGQAWPDEDQWRVLRAADRVDELHPQRTEIADPDGCVTLSFDLPMPAASLLHLAPGHEASGRSA